MFDNFNWHKYKTIKYPADNSLKTLGEIKSLVSKPLDKEFAYKFDNIFKVFKNLFTNRTRKFPNELVQDIITHSRKPIMKIKNYHDRKRPNVVAKEFSINLPYVKMESAQTPAFPSGHSAQAFLLKEVLSDMYPEMTPEFEKAAQNISKSRIMANVHYESDKKTGEQLGMDLYNYYKTI
tara:strand:+ start:490 stop:1026 length:537 start_codon:yes stop_codon:yes gene_type:complete